MDKVYILMIEEVEQPKLTQIITSSYRAPRHERKLEYYASRAGAEARQKEIYEGAKALLGFLPGVEVTISEFEVKP